MTGEEAKQAAVTAELALADECLAEARFALKGGFFRLVRSRAYYACFHAATAVFLAEGEAFRKHTGLMAAIDTKLVKSGRLPAECSSLMRGLYRARLQSDYGDTAPTTKDDATVALTDAEQVVSMLRGLLAL
jgi:uncharacterized protein (UPF0332 family)